MQDVTKGEGEAAEVHPGQVRFVRDNVVPTLTVTLGRVYDAGLALKSIIDQPRSLSQMANFRIAKLYETLLPFAQVVDKEKIALAQELGCEKVDEHNVSQGWQVPENKLEEYRTRLSKRCSETIVLTVRPLTLTMLGGDLPNGIEAREFAMLGEFVTE